MEDLTNFQKAHKFVAKWEGGLDDDPYDAGGITKYGVCIRFLQDLEKANSDALARMGIILPVTKNTIRNLTRDQAEAIFRWQFWLKLDCDRYPLRVAMVLYDAAVNCGRAASIKFAQRGMNAVGWTPVLVVDSVKGAKTDAALVAANNDKALNAIIDARDNYYRAIVKNKPSQSRFLKGWLNRTRDLRSYLKEL